MVRFGFALRRSDAEAAFAHAPSVAAPVPLLLLLVEMGRMYIRGGQSRRTVPKKKLRVYERRDLPLVRVDLFRSGFQNVVLVSGGVVWKRPRFARGRDGRLLVVHCIVHRRRLLEIFCWVNNF